MLQKRIDEKLQYYRDRQKSLPTLKERLDKLKQAEAKLQKQIAKEQLVLKQAGKKRKVESGVQDDNVSTAVPQKRTLTDEKLAQKLRKLKSVTDEMIQLEKDIDIISSGTELLNYQLEAGRFLFEYEQEKQVEHRAIDQMKQVAPTVSKLGSYLDRLPAAHGPEEKKATPSGGSDNGSSGDINLFSVLQPNLGITSVQTHPSTRQKEVYAEYLWQVENDDSRKQQLMMVEAERTRNLCSQPQCRGEMYDDQLNDHMMICTQCGYAESQIPDIDLGTFNEPVMPVQAAFAYKKKNHFRDWLAKSQGKENTTIPQVVYDSLLNELRKLRITRAEEVTRKLIHGLLTKLKMPKYYHNISQIHYHLTGKQPPQFTSEEEGILMEMFMQLEPVYEEVKPDNRSNFFSYEYCLNKFCEIQYELTKDKAWRRNLKYFKLLKGWEKLYQTEQRWKLCCKKLGWPFIKSI